MKIASAPVAKQNQLVEFLFNESDLSNHHETPITIDPGEGVSVQFAKGIVEARWSLATGSSNPSADLRRRTWMGRMFTWKNSVRQLEISVNTSLINTFHRVLAQVEAKMVKPPPERPFEGLITIHSEISPMASSEYEPGR